MNVDTSFLSGYQNFLAEKVAVKVGVGLTVPAEGLSPILKPHQRDAVLWCLRGGRRLLAMSFGLGKTVCQLEMMRQVHQATGLKTLVVCPLGVRHQFISEDGPLLGMAVQYVTSDEEVLAAETPFLLTNYERVRDGGISAQCIAAEIGAVSSPLRTGPDGKEGKWDANDMLKAGRLGAFLTAVRVKACGDDAAAREGLLYDLCDMARLPGGADPGTGAAALRLAGELGRDVKLYQCPDGAWRVM